MFCDDKKIQFFQIVAFFGISIQPLDHGKVKMVKYIILFFLKITAFADPLYQL